MSKNYDMIATVDIDLVSPIVDDASFGNLLIIGPLPATAPATAPAQYGAYASLKEVTDAGWKTDGAAPDPVGLAAQVAFSQNPKPSKIFIAPMQTSGSGESATTETANTTLQRVIEEPGWYVCCPAGVPNAQLADMVATIEASEKMLCYTELGFFGAGTGGANQATVGASYYRTLGIYGRESVDQADANVPAANKYINVAFTAKWLNYEPGSETTAFKQLAAVNPSALTATQMNALADAGLNYFITVGNRNLTMNGKVMAGEWADVIRFRDWLKNDMQVRVVNLFAVNPKIPYTDSGIALVQNQMAASLKSGQDVGGIAEGEFDENGDVIPGYVTSVPLAANLTASERASRILRKCKFKARLAGAIHFTEIKGSLTYEL